jgi:hypothetical protein
MTGTRQLPSTSRSRIPWSDRLAAVAQLKRIGRGGRPDAAAVKAVAVRSGVSTRTAYAWFANPNLQAADPKPPTRKRFEPTVEHLTVLAEARTARQAHETLLERGLIECSYPTFARALRERADPSLLASALQGRPGLITNRLYLSWTPPHRNHSWYLDHTEHDLWVWPSHRHALPIRPFITVIVDGGTGLTHAVPWKTDVNAAMVAAALVEFGTERSYYGVTVGGQPEQVICDNAAAHFGKSMSEGVQNLGWILSPTNIYSSFQNGFAERGVGLLNQHVANVAPGATKAGKTMRGASRHAAALPEDISPGDILPWDVYEDLVQDGVNKINTEIKMRRHGGLTRLEAYAADPTPQRFLSPVEYRSAFLRHGSQTVTATKNGLNFENRRYIAPGLAFGRRYQFRYLPTNREFIEVFSLDGEWLCTAHRIDTLSREKIQAFQAERARTERHAQAIDAGVTQYRRQVAALAWDMYGGEDTTWDGSEDRAALTGGISEALADSDEPGGSTPCASSEAVPIAADRDIAEHRASNGTAHEPTPVHIPEQAQPRRGRPRLPRVQVNLVRPDAAATGADDRLSKKFGAGLRGDEK